MDNKKIGQFISQLRKEQGLSQKELAEKLSVTDKAVSKWETGRGVPDISMLQPLASIFGVTVGELLNGERMAVPDNNDEQLIKKLKIKRYIRLALEAVITVIFGYWLYIFVSTFEMYENVLDMYLHRNEIYFLSVSTLIYIVVFAIWVFTALISAVLKKKAAVIKAVIICLTFSFIAGCSVHIAVMEDNRPLQMFDTPIDTIDYVSYDTFFDDEFETQISVKDTNETITENYSAHFNTAFDSDEYNFVNTTCVAGCEYDITKKYYEQQRAYAAENENYTEMNNAICETLGISEGYYLTDVYTIGDIEVCFVKGLKCYDVSVSESNISDERLINEIKEL